AGRCTTLDDGVDEAAPGPGRGLRGADLQPVSMPLPAIPPRAGRLDGAFVADIAFTVAADGAVSQARILCANPGDPAFAKALIALMPRWSFQAPPDRRGAAMRAAYRLVIEGQHVEAIPLGLAEAS
ncbi:MAG TPA: hypothetical protein VHV27_08460, partial [Phenylobacterium sp.]|nr:hypothetical protein [Phenylobacterium sp.]